jgi:hypothetical protein
MNPPATPQLSLKAVVRRGRAPSVISASSHLGMALFSTRTGRPHNEINIAGPILVEGSPVNKSKPLDVRARLRLTQCPPRMSPLSHASEPSFAWPICCSTFFGLVHAHLEQARGSRVRFLSESLIGSLRQQGSGLLRGVLLSQVLPPKVLGKHWAQNGSDHHQDQHRIEYRLVNQSNPVRVPGLESYQRRGQGGGDLGKR